VLSSGAGYPRDATKPPHRRLISPMRPPLFIAQPLVQYRKIKVPGSLFGPHHPHLSHFVSMVCPHMHAVKSRRHHSSEDMQPPSPYVPDLLTQPCMIAWRRAKRICKNSSATHQPPRFPGSAHVPNHARPSRERPHQIKLTVSQFSAVSSPSLGV
jgi:hypothetical protein